MENFLHFSIILAFNEEFMTLCIVLIKFMQGLEQGGYNEENVNKSSSLSMFLRERTSATRFWWPGKGCHRRILGVWWPKVVAQESTSFVGLYIYLEIISNQGLPMKHGYSIPLPCPVSDTRSCQCLTPTWHSYYVLYFGTLQVSTCPCPCRVRCPYRCRCFIEDCFHFLIAFVMAYISLA